MRPLLLDLFCGAGGAAMGYHRAGFDVVGVDINPQPNYPFEFFQGDAMAWVLDTYDPEYGFDAIHASPPCQAYSAASHLPDHPDLYEEVRELIEETGLPYVIENVPGAPFRSGITLCGSMFDLPVRRHRNFETSFLVLRQPCDHSGERPYTITGHAGAGDFAHHRGASAEDGPKLMDCDWMTWTEACQAIPPAYTEYIGTQLLAHLAPADPPREPTPDSTNERNQP